MDSDRIFRLGTLSLGDDAWETDPPVQFSACRNHVGSSGCESQFKYILYKKFEYVI